MQECAQVLLEVNGYFCTWIFQGMQDILMTHDDDYNDDDDDDDDGEDGNNDGEDDSDDDGNDDGFGVVVDLGKVCYLNIQPYC